MISISGVHSQLHGQAHLYKHIPSHPLHTHIHTRTSNLFVLKFSDIFNCDLVISQINCTTAMGEFLARPERYPLSRK